MKILLMVIAMFFLIWLVIGIAYAVSTYKDHKRLKDDFDKRSKKIQGHINDYGQRPKRRSLPAESVSRSRSSNSNSSNTYDPMTVMAVTMASVDVGSSSGYSGSGSGYSSGSDSSSSCSSSSSSSSSSYD